MCEFNYCGRDTTNFSKFKSILKEAGFSEEYVNNFKLVLWDVPNHYYGKFKPTFEDFADASNVFHMSGYDPAAVSFLMGKGHNPCNSKELFEASMDQELLNKLQIIKD